jgi:hypothetical protein
MDFLKIYHARKQLYPSPTSQAATSPKPNKTLVLEYADKSLKIKLPAIQSKEVKIAHLRFDKKPETAYTILTNACPMVFIVSLDGAAIIQFPDKQKVVLAKETSLLYFSPSEKIDLTPQSPSLSLVLFGGTPERTILPRRFQLLEDFFLKIKTGSSVLLFPGAYPLPILSAMDIKRLFEKNTSIRLR